MYHEYGHVRAKPICTPLLPSLLTLEMDKNTVEIASDSDEILVNVVRRVEAQHKIEFPL